MKATAKEQTNKETNLQMAQEVWSTARRWQAVAEMGTSGKADNRELVAAEVCDQPLRSHVPPAQTHRCWRFRRLCTLNFNTIQRRSQWFSG